MNNKKARKEKPTWSKGQYVFIVMLLIIAGFAWTAFWTYVGLNESNLHYLLGYSPVGAWLIGIGVGLSIARSVKVEGVDK